MYPSTRPLIAAAFLAAAPSFALGETVAAQWSPAADMPLGVQEIYAGVLDGQVFVTGGIPAEDSGYTDATSTYDPQTDTWTARANLPERRHHISLSVIGDQVYGLGGFTGPFPEWEIKSSVFIYDNASDSWSPGVDLPSPRGEHVSAVVDGKVYVIGGRTGSTDGPQNFAAYKDTSLNEVFDPATGTWEPRAPAPTARNSAAAAVIDGKIYVVGGREYLTADDGDFRLANFDTLEVYDPASDTWETRAPMPKGQGGLAAAALDGKLYAFGGEQWVPSPEVTASAYVYDPATDAWSELPDMPTARHGLAAAAVGSQVVVFGGASLPGIGAIGVNEVLTLD